MPTRIKPGIVCLCMRFRAFVSRNRAARRRIPRLFGAPVEWARIDRASVLRCPHASDSEALPSPEARRNPMPDIRAFSLKCVSLPIAPRLRPSAGGARDGVNQPTL